MSKVKTVAEFLRNTGTITELSRDNVKAKFTDKAEMPPLWEQFRNEVGPFTVTSRNLHEGYVLASPGLLTPGNIPKRS